MGGGGDVSHVRIAGWSGYQNTRCYISGGTGPAVDSWLHQRFFFFFLPFDNITRRVAVCVCLLKAGNARPISHRHTRERCTTLREIPLQFDPAAFFGWGRRYQIEKEGGAFI